MPKCLSHLLIRLNDAAHYFPVRGPAHHNDRVLVPAIHAGSVGLFTMGFRQIGRTAVATLRRLPRRQLLWTGAALLIVIAAVRFVPLPTALQMRDWARDLGPWFPLAFLGAHTIVTVLPFPRTAFTLAAGLLFGTQLGVLLAVVASTASAVLALWAVRALGWKLSALHPPSRGEKRGRSVAPARLDRGDVDATHPGGAVFGTQLRGRGLRRAGAALHAGHLRRSAPGHVGRRRAW
ncbi:TVP38/TMEM64 family membrane protein [Mycobacteroides abscessus 3A-0119-R]|nr:TVP38/TMEM64 family membrane protein [Mycobacteroides abscessus 3A-0119-R]